MLQGERIKAMRKEKGLTQSALADGIVTRNMLSLIESGSAKPSFQTAKKLAERLGVTVEYILSDDENVSPLPPKGKDDLSEIRDLFKKKDYASCINEAKKLDVFDDEAALIVSRCAYILGEQKFKERCILSALNYFSLADSSAKISAYATDREKALIGRMLSLCDAIISHKYFTDIPRVTFDETDENAAYIAGFFGVDTSGFELLLEHKNHMAIIRLVKVGRYRDAIKAIFEQLRITSDKLTRYFLFRTLEDCYRNLNDTKSVLDTLAEKKASFGELNK